MYWQIAATATGRFHQAVQPDKRFWYLLYRLRHQRRHWWCQKRRLFYDWWRCRRREINRAHLKRFSRPGGYVHAGKAGAGHYVKLVHNGIEFGMLQAIGEGMNLLVKYGEELDLKAILSCWENGSVIRSWLVQLMREQLEQKDLSAVPSFIEVFGEVNWLVTDAMKMEVSIPVIAQSVMQLIASRDNENSCAKAIAMMRHGFSGHPFGEDDHIKKERAEGQIKGFYINDKN